MRVLVVTSEWPTTDRPDDVPFLVEQVTHLRRAGVEVEVFSFRGRANPLRYGAAWLRVRAEHKLRSFDVVHAHFGQGGLVALPCPVPLVVTFHGSDLQGFERVNGQPSAAGRLLTRASRCVASRADRVIVVSDHLQELLPVDVKTAVIPCGIGLDTFAASPRAEARAELGLPPSEKLVLFVGDPSNPIKRHSLAAQAVAMLDPALLALLVVLHGQPHSQVPLFMSACDALIVTSRHEGSPTVVKEALACELPVVSLPVGDVVERTRHVPECRVCQTDEAGEIARCLDEVLRSGARAVSGRNAVADLDHETITARLMGLYCEVAETQEELCD